MKLRLYFDNQLITYVLRLIQKNFPKGNVALLMEIASIKRIYEVSGIEIEVLVSEESLAEIRKLDSSSTKRKDLEATYNMLKQSKSVIRNSAVIWNDLIATYNSPDIFYNHAYTDDDLDKVNDFLVTKIGTLAKEKLEAIRFDARYIANAMLEENNIDFFLTNDKKSLWIYKEEIEEKFGVKIRLPSELAEYLKYIK